MPRDNRGNPGRLRLPGLQRGVILDTTRGQARMRAWPKPRGKPKNPIVAANVAWFKGAKAALKRADPEQRKLAMAITKKTGLYPDDLLMMGMAGNLGPLVRDDGHQYQKQRRDFDLLEFQGAILNLDANYPLAAGTNLITWPLPVLDTAEFWSPAQPTRLTNTTGNRIVAWPFGGAYRDISSDRSVRTLLQRNGAPFLAHSYSAVTPTSGSQVTSGPLVMEPDDYIELLVSVNGATQLNAGPSTFLSLVLLQTIL